MKVVYCEFAHNGTFRHVLKYLPMGEAVSAIREGRDVEICIVPDGWGIEGFVGWTEEEKFLSTFIGQRV